MNKPLLLALFALSLAACGGAEDDLDTASDEVLIQPSFELMPPDGCIAIASVQISRSNPNGGSTLYRVRATGLEPNTTVRFDRCLPLTGVDCSHDDDATGWALVARVDAVRGPNGHYSATTYDYLQGANTYAIYRAKEAKGTAGGAQCPYTYSSGFGY